MQMLLTPLFALYLFVLSLYVQLVPAEDVIARHGLLATATATALLLEEPIYRDDENRHKTAAMVVAVQFRESSLMHDAVGDSGKSFCSMQIHTSSGGSQQLIDDPIRCVRKGIGILRQSFRVDRTHPIAFYARGPRFERDDARRISDDRVRLAKTILGRVTER